jgi:hypothetical protein
VSAEARLYDAFRARLRALTAPSPVATEAPFWSQRCRQIIADAEDKPLEDFLRWSDVVDGPEMGCFRIWYDNLRHSREWTRWRKLSRKSPYGNPHAFSMDEGTAPVPLQHVYHVKIFEALAGRPLTDIDVVVEVGGGYGNFCRVLQMDGFKGTHVIIDLPAVREIQRLFLSLNGVPVTDVPGLAPGACLLTEAGIDLLLALLPGKRVTFVATWSLSETPLAFRQRLFPALHAHCTRYLIASQSFAWPSDAMVYHGMAKEGEGVDNSAYFNLFAQEASPDTKWVAFPVPHHVTSHYLFGVRDA